MNSIWYQNIFSLRETEILDDIFCNKIKVKTWKVGILGCSLCYHFAYHHFRFSLYFCLLSSISNQTRQSLIDSLFNSFIICFSLFLKVIWRTLNIHRLAMRCKSSKRTIYSETLDCSDLLNEFFVVFVLLPLEPSMSQMGETRLCSLNGICT